MTEAKPDAPHFLDVILVIACIALVFAALGALAFVKMPEQNLPIFASLVSAVPVAILSGYIGFRWGASQQHAKPPAAGTVTATMTATAETEKPE